MTKYLENIKSRLKKDNIKGIALDIDETISYTFKYWVDELTNKFGNPDGLNAREIFKKYRRVQEYPHWQTKEALDWMDEARNKNEVQENIPLIENANHIVNQINKIIPVSCYITARPSIVKEGTQKWLDKHGFPKAELITCPKLIDHIDASIWKSEILKYLYPEVLGIVDDNLKLIDYLPANYKGTVFVYDYHKNYKQKNNLIYCKDWDSVLEKVKEIYA